MRMNKKLHRFSRCLDRYQFLVESGLIESDEDLINLVDGDTYVRVWRDGEFEVDQNPEIQLDGSIILPTDSVVRLSNNTETTADGYEIWIATDDDRNPSINQDVYYYENDWLENMADAMVDGNSIYFQEVLEVLTCMHACVRAFMHVPCN